MAQWMGAGWWHGVQFLASPWKWNPGNQLHFNTISKWITCGNGVGYPHGYWGGGHHMWKGDSQNEGLGIEVECGVVLVQG